MHAGERAYPLEPRRRQRSLGHQHTHSRCGERFAHRPAVQFSRLAVALGSSAPALASAPARSSVR
eukprot:9290343-Alexandrium_andersonii.AAC.1